jgi:hypothetical protein
MAVRDPSRTSKLANELLTELQRDNRDQRFHKRHVVPELHVMTGKLRLFTTNWSLGGMMVRGLPDTTMPGAELNILLWDGHDELRHHPVLAKVVRFDPKEGGHALQFSMIHSGTLSWLSDLQSGMTLS